MYSMNHFSSVICRACVIFLKEKHRDELKDLSLSNTDSSKIV